MQTLKKNKRKNPKKRAKSLKNLLFLKKITQLRLMDSRDK